MEVHRQAIYVGDEAVPVLRAHEGVADGEHGAVALASAGDGANGRVWSSASIPLRGRTGVRVERLHRRETRAVVDRVGLRLVENREHRHHVDVFGLRDLHSQRETVHGRCEQSWPECGGTQVTAARWRRPSSPLLRSATERQSAGFAQAIDHLIDVSNARGMLGARWCCVPSDCSHSASPGTSACPG